MKTIRIFLLFTFLVWGCSENRTAQMPNKPVVFAGIPPVAGIAKQIAGSYIEVKTLVGEGQSPHSYEPTAKQLAQLEQATCFFVVGLPFEKHLVKKIAPLYPQLDIVQTQKGIKINPADPHLWMSPLNAIVLTKNIVREYIKIDPTHAADFKKNEEALIEQLEKTDRIIRNQLAPFAGQRFYVFHPAFGYFAQTYHLHQVAIELNGKAPAPRQLAQLIEQAKKDRVHVIFVQKQFPARTAEAIATAIQGVVVPLNPLAEQLPENFKIMAEHLSRGLKNE